LRRDQHLLPPQGAVASLPLLALRCHGPQGSQSHRHGETRAFRNTLRHILQSSPLPSLRAARRRGRRLRRRLLQSELPVVEVVPKLLDHQGPPRLRSLPRRRRHSAAAVPEPTYARAGRHHHQEPPRRLQRRRLVSLLGLLERSAHRLPLGLRGLADVRHGRQARPHNHHLRLQSAIGRHRSCPRRWRAVRPPRRPGRRLHLARHLRHGRRGGLPSRRVTHDHQLVCHHVRADGRARVHCAAHGGDPGGQVGKEGVYDLAQTVLGHPFLDLDHSLHLVQQQNALVEHL
ncbi:hypothetical protein LTR60_007017, partial [Cryomyces antarcticus]